MKNMVKEIKSSMDYGFNDRFFRAEERIANQKIGQYLERSTERQKERKILKRQGAIQGMK